MTTCAPLRVAVVGSGVISQTHSEAIALHPGLKLAALVDPVGGRCADAAKAFAGRHPANSLPVAYESLTQALAADRFDLVAVCTPSGDHVDLALEAVASGAHVLVEKPVDVSLVQARRLLAAADAPAARGQVVSVVSQHRFDPASIAVHGAIVDGRFGRVVSAVASVSWYRPQQYYDSASWRGTWSLDGGGAVMNQGIHTVDLLLWFLGRPAEIHAGTALLAHERVEIEDVAVATIRFESGALATFHATTAAYPGHSVRIQVHGSAGSAVIDDDQLEFFGVTMRDRWTPVNDAAKVVPSDHVKGTPKPLDAFARGHLRQYEDVFDAIQTGRAPGVGVQDAYEALATVRGIYLSAMLGRPVVFDQVLDGLGDDAELRVRKEGNR